MPWLGWRPWEPIISTPRPVVAWRGDREFTIFYVVGEAWSQVLMRRDGHVAAGGQIVFTTADVEVTAYPTPVGEIAEVERLDSGGFLVKLEPGGGGT